ncbi:alpha-xylosidase, partial [Pseudomonas sp. HMWF031]
IGPREPWSYGDAASNAVFEALKLRYKLIPYLKETAEKASQTGLPVQRAMALAFPEQPLSHGFEQQFMCGDDLLVVPCVVPGGKIKYYLPKGEWIRFGTEEVVQGEQYREEILALNDVAVFIQKGSRIVMGPDVQHTDMDMSNTTHWPA